MDVLICMLIISAYHSKHCTGRHHRLQERTRSAKSELEEHSQQRLTKDGVHLHGKKQRWQLLTDTDGVGVWPNVSR